MQAAVTPVVTGRKPHNNLQATGLVEVRESPAYIRITTKWLHWQ